MAKPPRPGSSRGSAGAPTQAEWNGIARETVLVPELFQAQATRTPDASAVVFEGPVSYAELEARASRLARLLSVAGGGRGALVGVALERSADLARCCWGCG